MELTIGIYVFMSPALFDQLSGIFTATAESVDSRVVLSMVRVLVTMGALFVPAFLMGATFPAMIAGTAPRSTENQTAEWTLPPQWQLPNFQVSAIPYIKGADEERRILERNVSFR